MTGTDAAGFTLPRTAAAARGLLAMFVLLNLANAAAVWVQLGPGAEGVPFGTSFLSLFLLAEESNVPTWVSALLLAGTAAILALLAARSDEDRADRRTFGLLAGVFLLLSLDEASALHEKLGGALIELVPAAPGGLVEGVYIVAVLAILALDPRFLLVRLPRRSALLLALGGALYAAGGVLIKATTVLLNADLTQRQLAVLEPVEENFELLGAGVLALTFLGLTHRTAHRHPRSP